MTLGALLIAPQADKVGRKVIMLICAAIMGLSILATAYTQNTSQLILLRFISGLGIGGMLASTASLSSEYTPSKSKVFWINFVVGSYSIGAMLAGFLASKIIPEYGWRMMFKIAGIVSLLAVPLIFFFLSESLEYLIKTKPKNALSSINNILNKMQVSKLDRLPDVIQEANLGSVKALFTSQFKRNTILLWLAFFMAFAVLYFLLSWIPKLTTEAGMPEKLGIYSGTVFNLGSFIGILTLGSLSAKIGLQRSIFIFLTAAAIFMICFQFFTGSTVVLLMFGIIGFAMQGGFIGLYPVAARLYPTEFRTTGIGWAIGSGRFGAVLGPLAAGYMIVAGFCLSTNFMIFAIPCLLAAIITLFINTDRDQ